jgi:hypothetical protein
LVARGIQVLARITLAVQQRHADRQQAEIGGSAQRIAGEYP